MRRTIRITCAAIAVGLVLALLPTSANAVEPPPPPVTPFADLPSRLLSMFTAGPKPAPTFDPAVHGDVSKYPYGSIGWEEETAKLRAYLAANGYPEPSSVAVARAQLEASKAAGGKMPATGAPAARPLTAAAPLARAGGSILSALSIGWAWGSNVGFAAYAVGTNQTFTSVFCEHTPDWYQGGVASAVTFGFSPECTGPVADPNQDSPETFTGGGIAVRVVSFNGGLATGYCGPSTYIGAGSTLQYVTTDGMSGGLPFSGQAHIQSICGVPQAHYVGLSMPTKVARIVYTPVGSAPVELDKVKGDPVRVATCSITWSDGTTTVGNGTQYRESTGIPVSAEGLGCSEGWSGKPGAGSSVMPSRIRVSSTPDGGAAQTISDQTVPSYTADQRLAFAPGNESGLVLTKSVNGVTDSCMTWAANCSGWWAATQRGTVPATADGTYSCTYGGSAVALSECGVYATTFDVKSSSPTVTDPVTGSQTAWGTGQTSTPQNSLDPSTGPGTGENPSQDCMDQWASTPNPIEWVLHPVKCALVWAFVPRTSVVNTATLTVQSSWHGTPLGKLATAVGGWSFIPPDSDGCSGFVIAWSSVFGHSVPDQPVLRACPGDPLETTAQFSFWIIVISSSLGSLYALTRIFGSVVGQRGLGEGVTP